MKTGTVDALWRFPVKSFKGEKIAQVEFDKYGILGDRAYALIDKETGKVVSAKSVKLFPDLLNCSAVYLHSPQLGQEIPSVQITLADGTCVNSDSREVDQILSAYFERDVTLARDAPSDYKIDQYHPDVENLDPAGTRNKFTESKLGSSLFDDLGIESPLPPGSFMDVFPVSVISTSALERLHELRPETNFDVRRFRMNVVVKTNEPGFVENSWVGNSITIGNNVQLKVSTLDPRCVMTTLPQGDLPKDNHVLRTLVEHNRFNFLGAGRFPCAGVYAVVGTAGLVSVNDNVELS